MKLVRSTVSRALEARDKAGIRVRQPLAQLAVAATDFETLPMQSDLLSIIADEVNVKEVVMSSGVNAGEVALDTTISHELEVEGFVRELVREIQSLRKESGFNAPDNAKLFLYVEEKTKAELQPHLNDIKASTKSNEVVFEMLGVNTKRIASRNVWLKVEKI
jgi:isoleucyl-tRNA synthetase